MKQRTKRLIALSFATAMTGSFVAFAACGCDDTPQNNPEQPNPDAPVQGSTDESTKLLNSLLAQEFNAVSLNVDVAMNSVNKAYELNANGTKGEVLSESKHNGAMDLNVKANFKSKNMDITERTTSDGEIEDAADLFVRDMHAFSYDVGKYGEVTSYNGNITLDYGGSAYDAFEEIDPSIAEILQTMLTGDSLSEMTNVYMRACTYTFTKLADSFGGLTIEDNKATLDFNAVAYNMATEFDKILSSIDENTTLGELLAKDAVKNVLMSVTELFPVTDVKAAIDQVIAELPAEVKAMLTSMEIDLSKIFVEPDENSTTYDYIVKIISSNELKNAVNQALALIMSQTGTTGGMQITLPTTLDKMTLDFFFKLGGIDIEEIATVFHNYVKDITKTELVLNMVMDEESDSDNTVSPTAASAAEPENKISISNMKIVYTLSDNKVTKQDITANYSQFMSEAYDDALMEGTIGFNVSGSIEYSATDYTLTDISNCKTTESVTYYTNDADITPAELSAMDLTLKQNAKDGKLVSFTLSGTDVTTQTIRSGESFILGSGDETIELTLEAYSYSFDLTIEKLALPGSIHGSLAYQDGHYESTVKNILAGNRGNFVPDDED